MTGALKHGIAYLGVAGVAFGLGTWLGRRQAESFRELGIMVGAGWAAERASLLYREANPPEAREAILDEVSLLKELASHPELGWTEVAYNDLALAYMRLAILEERQGQVEESKSFMRQAEENARSAGWRDPTAAHIRTIVDRLDAPRERSSTGG